MAQPESPGYVLYVTTHGMDAPMKAALTFSAARAMRDYGRQTKVVLLDDAVLLLAPGVADHLEVPGRGKLDSLMKAAGTEIHC